MWNSRHAAFGENTIFHICSVLLYFNCTVLNCTVLYLLLYYTKKIFIYSQNNNTSVSGLSVKKKCLTQVASKKGFLVLSMCIATYWIRLNSHFDSFVWQQKCLWNLSTKLDTFSKLPYTSCCDRLNYLLVCSFCFFILNVVVTKQHFLLSVNNLESLPH